MVKDIRPLRTDLSNVDWLNAVRNVAGWEYQSRIPEATQANVQEVIQNLWTYRPLMNQFIDTLINRIGLVLFKNTVWSNPLAQFKRGFLEYGETIEEIMNGLLEATSYDPDRDDLEKEIFGAMTPEVQVNYHVVNRRDRYKLTIKEPLLRNAFTNANGLTEFVTNLMSMPQTSDQYDEFLIMANLFSELDKAAGPDGVHTVNVPDVSAEASDGADSRFLLRRLKEYSNTLPFISRLYNPAGMPVAARPEDLILFTTADADAAMDVEALAAAFNITKAEFGSRKIAMPQQYFGIDGVQAILTTKDFFVCADQRIDTTSIQNPAALFNNYWLHHWGVYSASRFAPFVMFNSERPSTVISSPEYEVTGIETPVITDSNGDVQATEVTRGELYDVAAEATTTPAGGPNVALVYAVVGATSAFTRITNNGVLYVAPDEAAQTLSIELTAVDSELIPQYTIAISRVVVGDYIRPWPYPEVLTDSDEDGNLEVAPTELEMDADDTVTIPTSEGYKYQKGGVDVAANSAHVITASTTFTAVALTGFEIATGATASWTFAP